MGWLWLLLIPGIPLLIYCCPVTVRLTFAGDGLRYRVSVAGLAVSLGRKATRQRPRRADSKPFPVSPGDIPQLIGPALEAVGRIASRCRVRRLWVRYTVGGQKDPAKAALRCGQAWAAGSALFASVREGCVCPPKAQRLAVDCDFDAETDALTLDAIFRWRMGNLLGAGMRLVWKYISRRNHHVSHTQRSHVGDA
jgi:hypothetical protein